MKIPSLITAFLFLPFAAFSLNAQQPTPSPHSDEDTVKITTSLIQLDVAVTDKKGNLVKDLQPSDFQVYQDGKLQTLTGLSYINGPNRERESIFSGSNVRDKVPIPSPPRSQGGRIITFLLDDGNSTMSFGEMGTMIDFVEKYMNEQMRPDDRVAIYRTAHGASLLPIYTANKAVLKNVLSRIHLPLIPEEIIGPVENGGIPGVGRTRFTGALFVLKAAIERLKGIPGRKIVFLLSNDPPGVIHGPSTLKINVNPASPVGEIVDLAGRASAVINTINTIGVPVMGENAVYLDIGPGGYSPFARPGARDFVPQGRSSLLADGTGGSFIHDNNLPDRMLSKILEKQTAYYLLSYEPDDETFKGKRYHNIEVKLTRPDLEVNTRNGFVGRNDAETRPVYKTADSPLYQAMDALLGESGMEIGLTVLHGNSAVIGNYLRPLFHINGDDLTLIDDADGGKKVVLDVVAVTLDEKSKVADEFNRTYTTRIPKDAVPSVVRNGMDFLSDMAVKKPGMYSFRLAVRDNASKRLGSASDYVEIEDVKKGRLFVAGLVTTGADASGLSVLPRPRPANAAFSVIPAFSVSSMRQYSKGSTLFYTYTVYNAKISPANGMPNLTRQIRLFRNGKLVSEGAEISLPSVVHPDPARIDDFGSIGIANSVEAGEYALQVIVRDKLANRVSTQWIDFVVTN